MVFRRVFLITGFLLIMIAGFTQEPVLQGSVKSVVSLGETFVLTYTLNGQGTDFRGPRLNGFEVFSGPNSSTSSSIQSIGGRTTMSVKYSFQYILQATQEGTFDIPAATINADHKTISSNTLSVRVTKSGSGGPERRKSRKWQPSTPGECAIQSE